MSSANQTQQGYIMFPLERFLIKVIKIAISEYFERANDHRSYIRNLSSCEKKA